jgi:Na+-transporting methylmalonyl-CoA/oxaloacetate decarboxylase gamma subunit
MLGRQGYILPVVLILESDAMNPYQVMGIIVSCILTFSGVVTLLTMQGMPLLLAFLSVYLVAIWCMQGMQKRARETFDGMEHLHQRRHDREFVMRQLHVNDFDTAEYKFTQQFTEVQF